MNDRPVPRRDGPRRSGLAWAAGLYALAAVLLWWHVWSASPSGVMTCGCTDAGRAVWFLEWPAFALTHGHGLWFSDWLFPPRGLNLLTDTSVPALALLLSPVTLAFGPVAGVNVLATLTPALASLSMFWFLRRWVAWQPAAFVGGLCFGFSPFVVVQLAFGWLNLAFVALLPLMAACVDELVVRRRARPTRVGAVLGALVAVEFLVSSELVVVVVASGAIVAVLLVAHAALHDGAALRAGAGHVLRGVLAAAGTAAALLAYPVWYFLAGPAHLSGLVWSTAVPGDLGNTAGNFWSHLGRWGPLDARQLAAEAATLGGYAGRPLPSPSYLGIGLLAVVAAGVVVWRRDRRLWLLGALGLATAALSLRTTGGSWGPWALVEHLPLLGNVVQSRFSAVVDLCAAAMLAIVVDRTRSTVLARRVPPGPGHRGAVPGPAAALGVAVVALVPMVAVLAPNLPLTVQPVVVPPWFTSVAPHLPPGRVVLTYPFATADSQAAIPWQAIAGMPYRMAGGGGPSGTVARAGDAAAGFAALRDASVPLGPPPAPSPATLAAVRSAMRQWGVTTVVVPGDAGLPAYDRGRGAAYGVAFLTAALGTVPVRQAGAWVWPQAGRAPAPHPVTAAAIDACVAAPGAGDAGRVARCVLGASGGG